MTRRLSLILAVLSAIVLLIPTSLTVAYFTSEKAAPQTTAGLGRWCAVPATEDASRLPNAYRLASMPLVGGSDSTSRMLIVPVVNNGAFGPRSTSESRHLGVRLWSCTRENLPTDSSVKITAWRNENASAADMTWLTPASSGFAGQRLDPSVGYGLEIADLHRQGNQQVNDRPVVSDTSRSRYSWLVSSGRTKSSTAADPSCADAEYAECTIDINPIPTMADAFPLEVSSARNPSNSVDYLASGYWTGTGAFTPTPASAQLSPYTGSTPPFDSSRGPTSTDGRQVQWVVLEWYGNTTPSDDLVIEVFLQ